MSEQLRVLVCGGRDFIDWRKVYNALDDLTEQDDCGFPTKRIAIIHGDCPTGADSIASAWTRSRGWAGGGCVEECAYPANWDRDGRAAGPIRNARMLAEGKPDLVLAFPGGRGTAHMVRKARAASIEVREVI